MASRRRRGLAVLMATAVAMAVGAAPAMAGHPFGYLDGAQSRGGGAVHIYGWTADPDSKTRAIPVHVWIDPGTSYARGPIRIGRAAMRRPDVANAYPGYGSYHGFKTTLYGLPSGYHNVCAYGINYGSGSNALLTNGCKRVYIPSGDMRNTYIGATSGWDVSIDCVKWAAGGLPTFTSWRHLRKWGREYYVKFMRANLLSFAVSSLGCVGLVYYHATPHQASTPPAVGTLDGGCDVEQARAMGFKPERGDCNH